MATTIQRAAGADLAAELLGHTSSEITKEHYIERDDHVDARTAEILESLAPKASTSGGTSSGTNSHCRGSASAAFGEQ